VAEPRQGYGEPRVPPHNLEAEQAVLGAMLLSPNAVTSVLEILNGHDLFYRDAHQRVFDAIRHLVERNQPSDVLAVSNLLETRGQLETVGGRFFMTDLVNAVATTANAEYYAGIVAEKALRRQLIRAGGEVSALGFDEEDDIAAVLELAEQKVFSVAQHRGGKDSEHIEPSLLRAYDAIERRFEHSGVITGTHTGFYDLNQVTTGFQPGNLIILGARPGMGKTSFALSVARQAAGGDPSQNIEGKPVIVFSLEMSADELSQLLLCGEARLNSQNIKKGIVADHEWAHLVEAVNRLIELPLYIDDTPSISVLEVKSKCRRVMARNNLDQLGLIVIDYLQLMKGGGVRSSDNRATEVSYISRALKELARELECPVMALSQLSRASEQSKDKKPMLSHLRESGSIEQDADLVMFIHRDDYYNPETSELKNQAEIIIAKNRHGPTASTMLYFHKEFTLFDNLEIPGGGY